MTWPRPTFVKIPAVRTIGHTLRGQGFVGRTLVAHDLRGLERRPGDRVLAADREHLSRSGSRERGITVDRPYSLQPTWRR